MAELSPAAQAVKDAVLALYGDQKASEMAWPIECDGVAAALQAVADQVVPDEPHPELSQFWDDEAEREWQNNQQFRRQLLAIAAELKAHD